MLLSFLNATLTIQFSYVKMLKGKEKVGHTKQFKWLPPIHTTMLRILVEEVAKGNKPSNTFKASSFALVAKEISAQFGVECHPSYVKNRLRTLMTMWTTIQTIRKKSSFGWDNNLKMITCDAKTYQEEFWYDFQLYFLNINDNICFWLL